MRLLFDLFPCQSVSRLRGVGRYVHTLALAMARERGVHDMHALANGLYVESTNSLRHDFEHILPPGHFSAYASTDPAIYGRNMAVYPEVATALIHGAYRELSADAILYGNPFEGWHERGVVPLPRGGFPAALRIGVLHDLIPWLFEEQYLNPVPDYKAWYLHRLAALQNFDLLLANSEATRQDAIEILHFPHDRIATISAASSSSFQPEAAKHVKEERLAELGITRPFVLYTGNGDYRKNQDGLLRAYARLPLSLRESHQLVLNQVGDKTDFRQKACSMGLTDDDVVVTDYITDDELAFLYVKCKVFIFPSLYEGFGFPILEAMACGAPVIAANNSSIPEVVGRSDILFDAKNPEAIAAALQNVLTDDQLRNELSGYGIKRAKEFSWEKTAALAWRAIEAGLETRLDARSQAAQKCHRTNLEKKPIAFVCTLSPHDSASVRHCLAFLPLLARHFQIDLFTEQGLESALPEFGIHFDVYPHTELSVRYARYATVVYQLANTRNHACMLPLMEAFPGVLVMHDLQMTAAVEALAQTPARASVLESEILHTHGLQGLIAYLNGDQPLDTFSLNRHVLESAQQLVLTSGNDEKLLVQTSGGAWLPPTLVLPPNDLSAGVEIYCEAIQNAIDTDQRHTIRHLGDALEKVDVNDAVLNTIAAHAVNNKFLRKQPRLLFDVTQLSKTDARSGIQRVVRNIARELGELRPAPRQIE